MRTEIRQESLKRRFKAVVTTIMTDGTLLQASANPSKPFPNHQDVASLGNIIVGQMDVTGSDVKTKWQLALGKGFDDVIAERMDADEMVICGAHTEAELSDILVGAAIHLNSISLSKTIRLIKQSMQILSLKK